MTDRTGSVDFGALVISLDFELHWGVRDHAQADGPYRANLIGVWKAVPAMLELFARREIAVTWATVGMLFADSREERELFAPAQRPAYADPGLDPYREPTGDSERDDPLHYAPSLIARIARTAHQEIGTHTFAHFYCLEPGQTEGDFRADLTSALRIAHAKEHQINSIVFPRNQHNPAYDPALVDAGIETYRGVAPGWSNRAGVRADQHPTRRAVRLLESVFPWGPARDIAWPGMRRPSGLYDVAASAFLRPVGLGGRAGDALRFSRLANAIRAAAERRTVFHLWWHPHNFGLRLEENLAFLTRLLDVFERCRDCRGMRSLTMLDTARTARAAGL